MTQPSDDVTAWQDKYAVADDSGWVPGIFDTEAAADEFARRVNEGRES